ncbi:MAG TPA: hypothetical protein VN865_06815 [Candidatus Acidoferrales bacterium]|jgi:hypothetical protein|nr:hypothetical protein [Candidatus Acidoferrales bacterium]
MSKAGHRAIAALAIAVAIGGVAHAADIKMAGKLNAPADASVVAICTDPVVQNVLNEDLRAARHGQPSNPDNSVTLTVSMNEQMLAPGVTLNQMFPGDPSMVELLKAAGADPPPLGDSGSQPIDPYANEARRQALNPDDSASEQFRTYQASRQAMNGAGALTPYDNIPKNQIYDTVIVARASLEGAADELKVVAVVHAGDDERRAKELVAEEIANAVLH